MEYKTGIYRKMFRKSCACYRTWVKLWQNIIKYFVDRCRVHNCCRQLVDRWQIKLCRHFPTSENLEYLSVLHNHKMNIPAVNLVLSKEKKTIGRLSMIFSFYCWSDQSGGRYLSGLCGGPLDWLAFILDPFLAWPQAKLNTPFSWEKKFWYNSNPSIRSFHWIWCRSLTLTSTRPWRRGKTWCYWENYWHLQTWVWRPNIRLREFCVKTFLFECDELWRFVFCSEDMFVRQLFLLTTVMTQ